MKYKMKYKTKHKTKYKTKYKQRKKEGRNEMRNAIRNEFRNSKFEIHRYSARSAFSALSGKGDTFETVAEFVGSLRNGVFLDPAMIPTLVIDKNIRLNACIFERRHK